MNADFFGDGFLFDFSTRNGWELRITDRRYSFGMPWEDFGKDWTEVCIADQTESLTIEAISGLDDAFWNRFCEWVSANFPNLRAFRISEVHKVSDESLAQVLKAMPKSINNLALSGIGTDVPLTFKHIGQMTNLTKLEVGAPYSYSTRRFDPSSGVTKNGCSILADALEKLTLLTELNIGEVWMREPDECWVLLTRAIRNLPKLENLHVEYGWHVFETLDQLGGYDYKPWRLRKDKLDSLVFQPLMRQVEKKFGIDEKPNPSVDAAGIRKLASAFDFVGDRLDYIHCLASKIDPNVLVRTVEGMDKRRERNKKRAKRPKAAKKAKKLTWKVLKKHKCRDVFCLVCGSLH